MGMIEYPRPDGATSAAYLAVPPDGAKVRGGVIVVYEWWGMNSQIQGTADRLAASGYVAMVPDFFHGQSVPYTENQKAAALLGKLDWDVALQQDLRGAVVHLAEVTRGEKVAVIGFCMGGRMVVAGLMQVPGLSAGVAFYGLPSDDQGDPGALRIPLQGHFASRDAIISPPKVDRLESMLRMGGAPHEFFRYDADHAFCNEARPERYDAAAAEQAWARMLEFLGREIG